MRKGGWCSAWVYSVQAFLEKQALSYGPVSTGLIGSLLSIAHWSHLPSLSLPPYSPISLLNARTRCKLIDLNTHAFLGDHLFLAAFTGCAFFILASYSSQKKEGNLGDFRFLLREEVGIVSLKFLRQWYLYKNNWIKNSEFIYFGWKYLNTSDFGAILKVGGHVFRLSLRQLI